MDAMNDQTLLSAMSFDDSSVSATPVKYTNMFMTLMNILNTLVGAEILGIPNSLTFCGLVPSVALLTACAVLSYISTIMIVRLQNRFHATSINDLTTKLLGRKGGIFISVLTLCFTYSLLVAYLVTLSDTFQSWCKLLGIPEWADGWRRGIILAIVALLIPVALTTPRNMSFLSASSTFAIACLVMYCVVIVIKSSTRIPMEGISPTVETMKFNLGFFNAFSIYCLMFALPGIVLPLLVPYDPSLNKRYRVVGVAFIVCYLFTIIPGVLGYLMFGSQTDQIIFSSFPDNDLLIQIARVGFFIVLNASYPVVGVTVMSELAALIFRNDDPSKAPTKQRIILLIATNLPPVGLACVLPKVRPALAIGGAIGGCMTNYFIPPLLWWKQSKEKWSHWANIMCVVYCLFGSVCAVIATYEAIIDAIHSFK